MPSVKISRTNGQKAASDTSTNGPQTARSAVEAPPASTAAAASVAAASRRERRNCFIESSHSSDTRNRRGSRHVSTLFAGTDEGRPVRRYTPAPMIPGPTLEKIREEIGRALSETVQK